MKFNFLLWSAVLLSNAHGVDLSGSYSAFPSSASEKTLMIQDLGGLIAGAAKQTVNVRGKLKVVQLLHVHDKIELSMWDDTGLEVLKTGISVYEEDHEKGKMVCISRPWTVQAAEGGSTGYGIEMLRMRLAESGDLIVQVESTQIIPKRLWRREKRSKVEYTFTYQRRE